MTGNGVGADAMQDGNLNDKRLGWVGAGRMGLALATRLLEAGCDVAVYNRTRSKCRAAGRARRDDRRPAGGARRPRHRVHDRRRPGRLPAGRRRARGAAVGVGARAGGRRRLDHDLGGGVRGGPSRGREARDRAAGGAGQRQPEGGQGRAPDDGHLRTRGGAPRRAALPRDHGRAAASPTAATATTPGWSRCATT